MRFHFSRNAGRVRAKSRKGDWLPQRTDPSRNRSFEPRGGLREAQEATPREANSPYQSRRVAVPNVSSNSTRTVATPSREWGRPPGSRGYSRIPRRTSPASSESSRARNGRPDWRHSWRSGQTTWRASLRSRLRSLESDQIADGPLRDSDPAPRYVQKWLLRRRNCPRTAIEIRAHSRRRYPWVDRCWSIARLVADSRLDLSRSLRYTTDRPK